MPYNKTYSKNRRFTKSKVPWYDRKHSVSSIARTALSTALAVKKLLNVEVKFNDTSGTSIPNNTGGIATISAMTKGTNYNQREGNSIKNMSIQWRGTASINASATETFVRLMIFRDNECQGAYPAVTDVLQSASVVSPLNHLNGKRFKILSDKVYSLSINGRENLSFKHFIKIDKSHCKYNDANAGDVTDQREGALMYLIISNEATNKPSCQLYFRQRFVDN